MTDGEKREIRELVLNDLLSLLSRAESATRRSKMSTEQGQAVVQAYRVLAEAVGDYLAELFAQSPKQAGQKKASKRSGKGK